MKKNYSKPCVQVTSLNAYSMIFFFNINTERR